MLVSHALDAPASSALAYWGPGGWHPGGFGFLFLLIPLFWIGVVVLIISLVSRRRRRFWAANGGAPWARGGYGGAYGPAFAPWGAAGWGGAGWGGSQSGSSEAEKTLAERFAQGDIDEVEYRARLEVLRANRPSQTPPAPPAA